MLEFIKWVLSDILRFIGFIIIIGAIGEVIIRTALAIRGKIEALEDD